MSSMLDDNLMKKIEEKIRDKLGGKNLESFLEKLKKEHALMDEEKGKTTLGNNLPRNKIMGEDLVGSGVPED
jgi:hypothetical protein